ncbi:hypothetical protein E8P82_08115 [Arthrobacter echini]|uniref:Uncharacterized protein n=1 Tax=Arthrobacter echini TaxID=1529066 RepID=A0A4S5E4L6_9MICC|nr:hypothetical protein [Arthrobacter echini]THJ66425.1 hypothetical protein E8P82_08115 [Arthrobacter echini]
MLRHLHGAQNSRPSSRVGIRWQWYWWFPRRGSSGSSSGRLVPARAERNLLTGAGFALSRRDHLPWLDAAAAPAVALFSTALVQQLTTDVDGTPGTVTMQGLLGAVLGRGILCTARTVLPPSGHRMLRRRLLAAVALGREGAAAATATIPAVSGSSTAGTGGRDAG